MIEVPNAVLLREFFDGADIVIWSLLHHGLNLSRELLDFELEIALLRG